MSYKTIIALIVSLVYIFLIQDLYSFRDNVNYRFAYDGMVGGENFTESFYIYSSNIGTKEPVLFVFMHLFSSFFSYDNFINALNLSYLYILFLLIKKNFHNALLVFAVVLVFDNARLKLISSVFSLLSHLQMFLIYPYFLLNRFHLTPYIRVKTLLLFSFALLLSVAVFFVFKELILIKIKYHLTLEFPVTTFLIAFFYGLFLLYLSDRLLLKRFVPLAALMILSSFVVSTYRVNIFLFEFIMFFELFRFFERRNSVSLVVLAPLFCYNLIKMSEFYVSAVSAA